MPERHASSAAPLLSRSAEHGIVPSLRVLLPLPLADALDYRLPDGVQMPPAGTFVRAPLGARSLVGVVWQGEAGEVSAERLKLVGEILPTPPLPEELRRFVERVAAYTLAPPGMVLKMAMSVPEALSPPRPRRGCALSPKGLAALAEPGSLTRARLRVLKAAREAGTSPAAELAARAGCGVGVVRDLLAGELLSERAIATESFHPPIPDWRRVRPALSADQRKAAQRLVDRAAEGGFSVTLLDGVTGSGKTETYFAAIAAVLAQGRQVLVLLPEIALGAQWLDRFRGNFGVAPLE